MEVTVFDPSAALLYIVLTVPAQDCQDTSSTTTGSTTPSACPTTCPSPQPDIYFSTISPSNELGIGIGIGLAIAFFIDACLIITLGCVLRRRRRRTLRRKPPLPTEGVEDEQSQSSNVQTQAVKDNLVAREMPANHPDGQTEHSSASGHGPPANDGNNLAELDTAPR